MRPIVAERRIHASQDAVFAFLADLRNHWELTDGRIALRHLNAQRTGGLVELRGPVGVRRRVRAELVTLVAPRLVDGRARLGRRTSALVRWELRGEGRDTHVRLSAQPLAVATLDRVALLVLGRRWLEATFAGTLATLDAALSNAPAPVV